MNFKISKSVFYIIIIMISLVFLIGCKEDPIDDPNDDPVDETPTLVADIVKDKLEISEQTRINAEISQTNQTLTIVYESSNQEIAVVDSEGMVTGVAEGEALISVKILEHPEIKQTITVNVLGFGLTLTGEDVVFIGESITLVGNDNRMGTGEVLWESSNVNIATVEQNGVVKGISKGVVTIKISSYVSNQTLEKTITVLTPEAISVEINRKTTGIIRSFSETKLVHQVLPEGASQSVIWTSGNPDIATVDQTGKVTTYRSGRVDIYATTTTNQVRGTITLNIEVDPVALVKSFHVENPIVQYVTTYGNTEKQQWVYGSVSKYSPFDMNLTVNLIPTAYEFQTENPYVGLTANSANLQAAEFKTIRSGLIKPSISSIIYHDTGNNNVGANATMHANYIVSLANFKDYKARSWHYSVDQDRVIQHLPDNEVGWQGDTQLAYSTTIGIESCVDYGSDLYMTWHRTAKLISDLMVKYNLKISDVKQHYDFSMKNCPQTLRRNLLYNNAIELVKAEYLVKTELQGYTVTFTSNAPEYVNNNGRIIKLPVSDLRISYTVNIKNNQGFNETFLLFSTIPANHV